MSSDGRLAFSSFLTKSLRARLVESNSWCFPNVLEWLVRDTDLVRSLPVPSRPRMDLVRLPGSGARNEWDGWCATPRCSLQQHPKEDRRIDPASPLWQVVPESRSTAANAVAPPKA